VVESPVLPKLELPKNRFDIAVASSPSASLTPAGGFLEFENFGEPLFFTQKFPTPWIALNYARGSSLRGSIGLELGLPKVPSNSILTSLTATTLLGGIEYHGPVAHTPHKESGKLRPALALGARALLGAQIARGDYDPQIGEIIGWENTNIITPFLKIGTSATLLTGLRTGFGIDLDQRVELSPVDSSGNQWPDGYIQTGVAYSANGLSVGGRLSAYF
jgi:hypothetical protein